MTFRIGLITTINTNIGDDFIREGLCLVLREVFKGSEIEFVPINKHAPHTAYESWHPIQAVALTQYLPRGNSFATHLIHSLLATPNLSKFERCDAIVQCGAPVLWPKCHRCEWAIPLWHRIVGRLSERIPVMNLAAGSCYSWERQPSTIEDQDDATFLRAIHSYCRLTTVRDPLSELLFKSLGCEVAQIPCSALLASAGQEGESGGNGLILVNYMRGGGHYSFGQKIDPETWQNTIKTVIHRLQRRHRIAFLCHNEAEARQAAELEPEIPRFLPKTLREYFEVAARAKAGIFNRMHASVGLAGMGIPSVAVCTDTRLLMVKKIGLPCYYVGDALADILEQDVENLLSQRKVEKERLLSLRTRTWDAYAERMSEALSVA